MNGDSDSSRSLSPVKEDCDQSSGSAPPPVVDDSPTRKDKEAVEAQTHTMENKNDAENPEPLTLSSPRDHGLQTLSTKERETIPPTPANWIGLVNPNSLNALAALANTKLHFSNPSCLADIPQPAAAESTRAPVWLMDTLSHYQVIFPDDKIEAIFVPTLGEWRMRCLDCSGKLYRPEPGCSVDDFLEHIRNPVHRSRAPGWLKAASHHMRMRYPNAQFKEHSRSRKHGPSEWRMKCLDCPGKLYDVGPGESLSNFSIHLRNRCHVQRVNERIAAQVATMQSAEISATSDTVEEKALANIGTTGLKL
ncbi:hypothetical protein NP233_g8996 [Leucocoprinus birnbaumii]|uniref:Uncharacterized protein n=1 Tax=Leucocoprinus birnbaumii TaxID=56174 RepID=A0AAD5VNP6_9AGAR|nr:hypothetical protein NP233_g8996 [Leucocoprinus birnbaumii]